MALLIALLASTAPARADDDVPRFRHTASAEHATKCNDCHHLRPADGWAQRSPVARNPEPHAPCSSNRCHAAEWTRFDPRAGSSFCKTCHTGFTGGRATLIYPPYRQGGQSEFTVPLFGHKEHLDRGLSCEGCHRGIAGPATSVAGAPELTHTTCGSPTCHGGRASPPMADCQSCHEVKTGGIEAFAALRRARQSPFQVAQTFSHEKHRGRGAEGSDCTGCHARMRVGPGEAPARPEMVTCERCHDGKKAFSALGTQCRRCHTTESAMAASIPAGHAQAVGKSPSFNHRAHAAKGVQLTCSSCHATNPKGELSFPAPKEHQPCATCHSAEYRKAGSTFCATCHERHDPWSPAPLRKTIQHTHEFKVILSHKDHAATDCSVCHLKQAGRQGAAAEPGLLAPKHALCAGCHESAKKPPMTECASCHHPMDGGEKGRTADEVWRVAPRFSHDTHRMDVRTARETSPQASGWARVDPSTARPTECRTCHEVATGDLPGHPKMAACGACHDGRQAFKVTGFFCARCHSPPVGGQ